MCCLELHIVKSMRIQWIWQLFAFFVHANRHEETKCVWLGVVKELQIDMIFVSIEVGSAKNKCQGSTHR